MSYQTSCLFTLFCNFSWSCKWHISTRNCYDCKHAHQ